jgi:hypothetical protein
MLVRNQVPGIKNGSLTGLKNASFSRYRIISYINLGLSSNMV